MSYHSCCDINVLFTRMFPDSEIARQFTCSENKCSYLCRFGLAPYFRDLFLDDIKVSDEFVILFDESLNFATQRKQMDLHVRLWDVNSGIVYALAILGLNSWATELLTTCGRRSMTASAD